MPTLHRARWNAGALTGTGEQVTTDCGVLFDAARERMMTWLERIVAARARGGFTPEDRGLARNLATCAYGEIAGRFGFDEVAFASSDLRGPLDTPCLSGRFTCAVRENDFTVALDTLEAIEDRGLIFKREQPSNVGRADQTAHAGDPQGVAAQGGA